MNFQVGELGSVSTIFQDRGQEKALPHRQKNDRAVRVVAEPRCCSSDGSDVLADWRAGSRGAIVGWRDGRIARWMGVDGTGGWAARCEAVESRARTKRRTGRRKPRAGRWSVEREKLGPERRLEAGGWRLEGDRGVAGCGLLLRAGGRVFSRWVAGQVEHAETIDGARGRATPGSSGRQMRLQNSKSYVRLCLSLLGRWQGQERGEGSAQRRCRMVGAGEISRLGWEVESFEMDDLLRRGALVLANRFGGPQPDPLKNAPTAQCPLSAAQCPVSPSRERQAPLRRPHLFAGHARPNRRLVRAVGSLLSCLFSLSLGSL